MLRSPSSSLMNGCLAHVWGRYASVHTILKSGPTTAVHDSDSLAIFSVSPVTLSLSQNLFLVVSQVLYDVQEDIHFNFYCQLGHFRGFHRQSQGYPDCYGCGCLVHSLHGRLHKGLHPCTEQRWTRRLHLIPLAMSYFLVTMFIFYLGASHICLRVVFQDYFEAVHRLHPRTEQRWTRWLHLIPLAMSYFLATMFVFFLGASHPRLRVVFQDYFEAVHHFFREGLRQSCLDSKRIRCGQFCEAGKYFYRLVHRQFVSSPNFWFSV